ncbi:MAG TPA: polysaccharide deacetylase family protein, partial [Acidimicrobiia bacterium]
RGDDPHNLFVAERDFARQLGILAGNWRALDLDGYLEALRSGRWPRRSFLLTIDDGFISTLEIAAPLLSRFHLPAVLFVCPGLVGHRSSWMPEMPDEGLLTAEQIRTLGGAGMEIGVHGMDHVLLQGLDPAQLRRQVEEAKESVEAITGTAARAFAYPEGVFDRDSLKAVRDAGFAVGFSVHRDGGPFAIPRRPINTRDSMATFRAKLLPGFNRLWSMSDGHPVIRRAAARLAGQRRSG